MREMGKYIYGIIASNTNNPMDLLGIDNELVYTITYNGLAAIVSDFENTKIRPERRHIAAHQHVMCEIMKRYTVLPTAFGHVADNADEVKKILRLKDDTFKMQLEYLNGKVEMALKVFWNVENIFEYFVRTSKELEIFRDAVFSDPHGPSREAKIELGRMFECVLNNERDSNTLKVHKIMAPYCHEIIVNKPRHEKMVMDLACLIDGNSRERFEGRVFEALKTFDDNFLFNINGPLAPHSFVNTNNTGSILVPDS